VRCCCCCCWMLWRLLGLCRMGDRTVQTNPPPQTPPNFLTFTTNTPIKPLHCTAERAAEEKRLVDLGMPGDVDFQVK
jgi:hypothetical protein